MIARKSSISSVGRATVFATVAALALSTVVPSAAMAAPRARETGKAEAGKAVSAASDATDFSARRRVAVRHRHRGGGGAAAAAAFAGIVGTGLAIAAAQNRRAYYDDYYGGPYYRGYGPPYGYYYSPGW